MWNEAVSQESPDGMETGPESDEVISSTPHRQLVIQAGNRARLEQRRLEKQLGLQDGRTPG